MTPAAIGGRERGASDRDWPPLPELEQRPMHRAVLGALGPVRGARLLDVACGVGLLMRHAECRGALVSGVDTAVELLEIARWALPEADLRVGGVDALPFEDGSFDLVTACAAVRAGHTGLVAALAELVRVVRPGGRLAVGGRLHPAGCWAQELDDRLRELCDGEPTDLTEDLIEDPGLAAALGAAGLTVVDTGELACPTVYPSRAAAWTTLLAGEHLLLAIRLAGERAVRAAFLDSVGPAVAADGTVRLPTVFRYAVAVTPDHSQ